MMYLNLQFIVMFYEYEILFYFILFSAKLNRKVSTPIKFLKFQNHQIDLLESPHIFRAQGVDVFRFPDYISFC